MTTLFSGPSQNPKTFGEQIRKERKALHMRQGDIAAASGLDRKTIIALEKGENVSMNALFAVLAALGMGCKLEPMRPSIEHMKGVMDD